MHNQEIRRRDNGTIDIDYYRQRGLSMRREAMATTFKGIRGILRPAIAIATLAVAAFSLTTRAHLTGNEPLSSQDAQVKQAPSRPGTVEPI